LAMLSANTNKARITAPIRSDVVIVLLPVLPGMDSFYFQRSYKILCRDALHASSLYTINCITQDACNASLQIRNKVLKKLNHPDAGEDGGHHAQ
ncbi:MAG TPA: hypothetical protein VJ440_11080, partial [Candidatus Brocadiaceae bacterium]|nr:hypothetical protein [Candidatus Brocadiaceae bacterium]